MTQLFPKGYKGLSDSKHSGVQGSVYRSVGMDYHSEPGIFKAHQKLTKHSGSTVDELCKHGLNVSDGSRVWFSSESGKIWREDNGTYTHVFTTNTTNIAVFSDVLDTSDKTQNNTLLLTDDTSLTNDCTKIGQTVRFTSATELDAIQFYLRSIGGLNGGYSLKLSIQENGEGNESGQPDGTDLHSVTQAVTAGQIPADRNAPYKFVFADTITLDANKLYWLVLEVTDYGDIDPTEAVSVSVSEDVEDQFTKYFTTEWTGTFENGGAFVTRFKIQRSIDRSVAIDNLSLTGTRGFASLSAIGASDRCAESFGQSFILSTEKVIDTASFNLLEIDNLNGGYTLKVAIETDDNNKPSGIEIASTTKAIGAGDIPSVSNVDQDGDVIDFDFGSDVTLFANTRYWITIRPTSIADIPKLVGSTALQVTNRTGNQYASGELLGYRDINTDSTHKLRVQSGSSQSASITNASQAGLGITGDITLEAEIQPESSLSGTDKRVICAKHRTDGNQRGYSFGIRRVSSVNYLFLEISSNGSSSVVAEVPVSFGGSGTTARNHVAVVYNASAGEATFYTNGVQFDAVQTGLPTVIFSNTSNFTVGADNAGTSGAAANFFNGFINDVRVWNTQRTASQILQNKGKELVGTETNLQGYWKFNNAYTDSTANANTLTASNTPTFTATTETKWSTIVSNFDIVNQDALFALKRKEIAYDTYGEVKCLGAAEHNDYIYWATEKLVNRIPISQIITAATWSDNAFIGYGIFENGDTEFHPMVRQNLQLFIADKYGMAKINEDDEFEAETNFNLPKPERIKTMTDFDIDILVGTTGGQKARVLRWNTEGESWSAEDDVEHDAINAFVKDDNYVYVQAGGFGDLYFYNGEKMEVFKKISGSYSPTAKVIINPTSVATLYGIPRFGLSNVAGNPTLQGVYSFGSYSREYPKVMDLTFPVSFGAMQDMNIGAMLTNGGDIYVSWKSTSATPGVGIDKIDYTAKYTAPYIETVVLTAQQERGVLKNLLELTANYSDLPTNTGITFGVKKNYEASFTNQTSKTDTKLSQIRAEATIPEVSALQLRLNIITNGNNTPLFEGFETNPQKK